MRALQVNKLGDCRADREMLTLRDTLEKPTLAAKSSDLLLRVLTCAINPGDLKLMTGALALPKVAGGAPSLPYTPGLEVCGIVEAVGDASKGGFSVGDRVVAVLRPLQRPHGTANGGLAEYVIVESALTARVPDGVSAVDAASLSLGGALAMHTLKDTKIGAGSKVLVLGASTSVGSLVVQLAKHAGAEMVVGTTPEELMVKSLPLDRVIVDDNKHDPWWEVLDGAALDVVVDCVGAPDSGRHADKTLIGGGIFATVLGNIVSDADLRSVLDLLSLGLTSMWRTFWRTSRPQYKTIGAFPTTAGMEELLARVADGAVTPLVDPACPLAFKTEAMEQAVAMMHRRTVRGKLIMTISDQ